jgi:hypothetical protein
MRAIAISRNQVHCFSLFFPLCSILNSQQVGHRDKVPGNLGQDLEWGAVPPAISVDILVFGERYRPERCGALPGWRGGTNERSLLRHLLLLRGARKRLNLYSLTDVPWSHAHQLMLDVDGGVELPYEQRAAVLRSQRPLAQLCRNSHFSTDCRDMIFAISCTTCFGGDP